LKKEINTLFAIIRCAVLGETMSEAVKQEAVREAELLYKMARHHDMAHLLDYAYKVSGISVPDEKIAFEFIKQNAVSVMRYENINFALANISALFEQEKIPFVPLKGSVIRDLYPEPWMRTSCDIDVLVHEPDLDRAENLLIEKLGYSSKGKRGYHDISLYSDNDVHLELHFNIKENRKNIDVLLENVWDYAKPKTDGSFEHVLTPEFLLFQHIAHMSYHVSGGGCSLRYFLDLYLLENKLEIDRSVFNKMLKECGLERFYETSSKLAKVWFSNEKHDDVTLSYQRYILNGGIYGTKINSIAAKAEKKSTLSYIFGRVFMPYEQLCVTYPSLKEKKLLLPFYQVRRWGRILKNRRYKNASDEIQANNSVSKENTDEFSRLLERLKLK